MRYAHRSSSSTCVDDDYSGHHRELPEQRRKQREGVLSKFLKKALPAPLHPSVRGAVLFVMVLLRRRLRRTWRSGLKRHVRGRRNRLRHLRRKLKRRLRDGGGKEGKQPLWLALGRKQI